MQDMYFSFSKQFAVRAVSILVVVGVFASPLQTFALVKTVGSDKVVDSRDYPIIFVHGAAGADLEAGGYNAWPGALSTNDSSFDILGLKDDGRTPCCSSVAVPTEVMRYGAGDTYMFAGDLHFAAVYQGFYDYMAKEGYTYNGSEGKVFYDFVYDWRQDNKRWTAALNSKIDDVLRKTKADKVILVGHSMGGIQIRLLMNEKNYAQKVGGVIFLATPHHGAPMVYWAYTYGYNFGNKKVSDAKMWEIMKNWGAGYQLLPDYPIIQDAKTGRVWSLDEMYGNNFVSYQEYEHYKAAKEAGKPYVITYGLPNKKLLKEGRDMHSVLLGDAVTPYPDVNYYMIAGDNQKTVYALRATLTDVGLDKPLLTLEKMINTDGDGTVPSQGARIEGVAQVAKVSAEHGDIASTAAADNLVSKYRAAINDEEFRTALATKAKEYAQKQLPRLMSIGTAKGAPAPDGPVTAIGKIFWAFIWGAPDEEKIKQRDDLRASVANTFRDAKINIEIKGDAIHKDDALFAILDGFSLGDIGTGRLQDPTMTVHIPSYELFNQIASGSVDPYDAYRTGKIQIGGNGIVQTLKMKIISWVAKYAPR